MKNTARAMTIAGSDSGGGAGLQADLKTFTAFGVYGSSVITSITAQNTRSVLGIQDIPPEMVGLQIEAVLTDIGTDAVKTGMLSNRGIIREVVKRVDEFFLEPVVDPVMVTKGGDMLLKQDAVDLYSSELVPRAKLLTPNIREVEVLTGIRIRKIEDMVHSAELLIDEGARSVVVKGGEFDEKVIDVFHDGKEVKLLKGEEFEGNKHGSGCTYSAAITALLALGKDMREAVTISRRFVEDAIKMGSGVGRGERPVNHSVWLNIKNNY